MTRAIASDAHLGGPALGYVQDRLIAALMPISVDGLPVNGR